MTFVLSIWPIRLRERWTALVLHSKIIGWSDHPGPTLNTEYRVPCYKSQQDTLPLDHWAIVPVPCLPTESVPWLRETDLDPTRMARWREPDREVASSTTTHAKVPSTQSSSLKAILEPHSDNLSLGYWGKLCWASPAKWTMKTLSLRPPVYLTSGSVPVTGITHLKYIHLLFSSTIYPP